MNKNYFSEKYNGAKKFFQLEKTRLKFVLLFFFFIATNFATGQETILQFNFENNYIPNINKVCSNPAFVRLVNNFGVKSDFQSSASCNTTTSNMLMGDKWTDGESYRITVNTSGYEKLQFSYCNKADAGIGRFITKVSTDNGVSKQVIINSYTPSQTGSTMTSIILPDNANNKGEIFLYIEKVGNAGVKDSFYIDDITLTGTQIVNGIVTSSTTVCSGINSTELTLSGYAGTVQRWESSLDNFATAGITIVNATTKVIATNVTATTSYRAVTKSGTCPERYSGAATVTVNPIPTTPITGKITHYTCATPAGSVFLSGLTVSTTLVQTGPVNKTYTITDATMTISGLAAGSYYFAVLNGTCESVKSSVVAIDGLKTTKWNGSGWDNDTPTIDKNIIFDAFYQLPEDTKLEGCSCEVNTGKSVLIAEGAILKIYNGVKVLGTGSLTFENNSSLVQINEDPAINIGNIIYKRKSRIMRISDYTYWSSPVASQILKTVSPNTNPNRFWSFDAATNNWVLENTANIMIRGKGYIIRGPEFFPANPPSTPTPITGVIQAPFEGVPHNGQFEIDIAGVGTSNLIGNPYPSALDAESFLRVNSLVLQGTLYFWTHNTAIREKTLNATNEGSGYYVYISDDYASYNLTGGVGTEPKQTGNTESGIELLANKPSGKIASGQGFFATGKATGKALFKNSMRVGVGSITGDNKQFFKTIESSKKTNSIQKNRVWLNLTNQNGAFKQLLIGYITDATNGYDNAFDGANNNGNQFVNFYSINQDKNLTIQGRALPFDENDVVPLGYSSVIQGSFSISIDEIDGMLTSENIYLQDKSNNSTHNLKKAAYTFDTGIGAFNERFELRFTNKTVVSADFALNDHDVLIAKDKNELKIKSQTETINRITVFDLLGTKLFDKVAVNSNEFQTAAIKLSNQVIAVKVTLANGKVISKKVIY